MSPTNVPTAAPGNSALPRTRQLALVALLVATGIVVYIFEGVIPRPLPWVRPGLANVVTLVALELLGAWPAALVAALRILLAALLLGTFGNVSFLFSAAGGTCALAGMLVAHRWFVPPLSLVGVGLVGAFFHATGQLAVAWAILVRSPAVLGIASSLLLSAALAGLLVGVVAQSVVSGLERLSRRDADLRAGRRTAPKTHD